MLATLLLPIVLAPMAPACNGADPAIAGVTNRLVTTDSSGTNHYQLTVTVVNRGQMGEPSNALISVDIWQDENHVNRKGLPPLKAGQVYKFTQDWVRASDAEAGTTTYRFALNFAQPPISPMSDCDTTNDRYRIRV